MQRDKIHIGTSGWQYNHWYGSFYPKDIRFHKQLISFYAQKFHTVELNTSFYHVPSEKAIQEWKKATPQNFIFSYKVNRYITHMKKLNDPGEALKKLFTNVSCFGEKLGPLLFQLPPKWHKNTERLREFIKQLTTDYRYAFEFRDRSWLDEDIYELLREYNIASCFYDFKAYQAPEIVTSDLIYIRLHGPHAAPYTGSYSGDTLAHYATKIHNWHKEGKLIYCYFDNDQNAYAPRDSQRLIEFLEKYSLEEQT